MITAYFKTLYISHLRDNNSKHTKYDKQYHLRQHTQAVLRLFTALIENTAALGYMMKNVTVNRHYN